MSHSTDVATIARREDVECQWADCREMLPCPQGRGRNPKWCPSHRAEMRRMTRNLDDPMTECVDLDCSRPVRARQVCNMHYKRMLAAEGRFAPQPWDDRRRTNHHLRRARKRGATVEPVSINVIAERDNFVCGICHTAVDMSLAYPDPLSKSLDHIVPLAKGGEHSLLNCQLSHLTCNVSKGARLIA